MPRPGIRVRSFVMGCCTIAITIRRYTHKKHCTHFPTFTNNCEHLLYPATHPKQDSSNANCSVLYITLFNCIPPSPASLRTHTSDSNRRDVCDPGFALSPCGRGVRWITMSATVVNKSPPNCPDPKKECLSLRNISAKNLLQFFSYD